ncbi:MAG: energy transducer TonB [Pseudomonadota bacterium]|nr:energy transducer TonB [Pseudomonadota bacterium]
MGEEGKVRVRLCIGANGRVTSAEVIESSKFPRLDEAGVKMAKQYRFKPGTEDGKVRDTDCFSQLVTFSLKEG